MQIETSKNAHRNAALHSIDSNHSSEEQHLPPTSLHERFHFSQPLSITNLHHIASKMDGTSWSAMVAFEQELTLEAVTEWKKKGLKTLHFEIKGYCGFESPEAAIQAFQANHAICRQLIIPSFVTLVYGYPKDNPVAFRHFAAAFVKNKPFDVLTRLKLYRLTSALIESPETLERLGIKRVISRDDLFDLARFHDFVSESDMDSREFSEQVEVLFTADIFNSHDFIVGPLAGGEFLLPEVSTNFKKDLPHNVSLSDRIQSGIATETLQSRYRYGPLDEFWGAYLPRKSTFPGARVEKTFTTDKYVTLGMHIESLKLIEMAPLVVGLLPQSEMTKGEWIETLPSSHQAQADAIFNKLYQGRYIVLAK